jgi:hypothetical protein
MNDLSNEYHKFRYYSAHDSTVNALLITLDVLNDGDDDQTWPPFASNIIFELWKDTSSSSSSSSSFNSNYFVKVFYLGKLLKLPISRGDDNKCSLNDFDNLMKETSLNNEQHKQICSQTY